VVVLCGGVWLLTALWFVVVAVCWLLFGQLVCSWWVILWGNIIVKGGEGKSRGIVG